MNLYSYDMHVHSAYSDGDLLPSEIFSMAISAGLKGLVLSDHNVFEGTDEFCFLAKKQGMETLEGIEITSRLHDVDVHVLGYSAKFDRKLLESGLKATVQGYRERVKENIDRLVAAGYGAITFSGISGKKGLLHPYDIARVYSKNTGTGVAATNALLRRGGPAYVPYGSWVLHPKRAIDLVHEAGGIAVLAHPGDLARRRNESVATMNKEEILEEIVSLSLDGIEVFSPRHSKEEQKTYESFAKERDLLITGGSDFHGPVHHPEIVLGSGGVTKQLWDNVKRALHLRSARS